MKKKISSIFVICFLLLMFNCNFMNATTNFEMEVDLNSDVTGNQRLVVHGYLL